MAHCLILGCGFTGSRVAVLLKSYGHHVLCASRRPPPGGVYFDAAEEDYRELQAAATQETLVLHSIPTLKGNGGLWEATPRITAALAEVAPQRLVYLSTTGVYGETPEVDEHTPPNPHTEREQLRWEAEQAIASGPWSSLVLRPAAIYGPGRGMHSAMRAGQFQLKGNGENYVSRIHVEDLARIAAVALLSPLQGFYPVADDEPCLSRQAAEFCAVLLGIPMPPEGVPETLGETRRANRRVDGTAIRRRLGITLRYPTYREGFPACLEAEALAFSIS